jgi:hypothetical protein
MYVYWWIYKYMQDFFQLLVAGGIAKG